MSRFRRFEIIEDSSPFFITEPSIFTPKTLALNHCLPTFAYEDHLSFALDLLNPTPKPNLYDFTSPFEGFDTVTNLIQIDHTPFSSSYRRTHKRVDGLGTELYLRSLSDRVSAIELSFDRLVNAKIGGGGDRKYTWTEEIKDGVDRKYKWTAEIKGGKNKKKSKDDGGVEKSYKWTAEIKGKGDEAPISRTCTLKVSSGGVSKCSGSGKKEKKEKEVKKAEKGLGATRVVEIEGPVDQGAVFLRQAFARRAGAVEKCKGKKKELLPQDAALMIQLSFRAYLIRRSQALRALRELAVAKAKLKEIRALFNNFSYRRRITHDAEELQKFSEKIIVLLLTVDGIEGADLMVRAAKRSMVDELEAMLDVVDPQPPGKSLSMRRRMFDMPNGGIQKEIAAGVAKVVQMLDEEENGTFEACL